MARLKALRGSIGTYGRVAAGGIVDVDDAEAKKLLETKRFERATDADLKAAQAAQEKFLKVAVAGAAPGFAALAEPPPPVEDEFAALEIDEQRAELDRAKQSLASEAARLGEVEAGLIERHGVQEARHEDLNRREDDLVKREGSLAMSRSTAEEEAKRLHDWEADLNQREEALKAPQTEAPEQKTPEADAADKAKKTGK